MRRFTRLMTAEGAEHVFARHEAGPDEVALIPFLPRRHELLERADVDALLVDCEDGGPVGGKQRLDRHRPIVRVTFSRERKRRSWVTTTRQPS